MKTLFTHAKLIFPDGIRDDLLLTMENGVISEISQKRRSMRSKEAAVTITVCENV